MKVRIGFVSNSSSCSFTCEVCGDIISGYDVDFEEFGLWQCSAGHLFHEKCSTDFEAKKEKALPASIKEYVSEYGEWCNECPISMCPICCFEHLSKDDELLYYRKKFAVNPKKILQGIKDNFKSYAEFSHYICSK